jgi:hypothetical protein
MGEYEKALVKQGMPANNRLYGPLSRIGLHISTVFLWTSFDNPSKTVLAPFELVLPIYPGATVEAAKPILRTEYVGKFSESLKPSIFECYLCVNLPRTQLTEENPVMNGSEL